MVQYLYIGLESKTAAPAGQFRLPGSKSHGGGPRVATVCRRDILERAGAAMPTRTRAEARRRAARRRAAAATTMSLASLAPTTSSAIRRNVRRSARSQGTASARSTFAVCCTQRSSQPGVQSVQAPTDLCSHSSMQQPCHLCIKVV